MAFPTLTPAAHVSNNAASGSWTLAQGANAGLIGFVQSDNNHTGVSHSWGGLDVPHQALYGGSIQQSFYSEIYALPDLTGKSGDSRAFNGNGAGARARLWVDYLVAEQFEVVNAWEQEMVNVAYMTASLTVDCGADDAALLVYMVTDHGSDWATNPITNTAGLTLQDSQNRYYAKGYGRHGYLLVPGGTGSFNVECGSHGSDKHFAAMAIKALGGGGKRLQQSIVIA